MIRAGARRGERLFALVAGLGLSLGGAFLFAQDPADDTLVGSKTSKVYHRASCETAKKFTEKNKFELLSADEARINGLKPCPICKPPGSAAPKSPAKKGEPAPGDAKSDDPDGDMKPAKTTPTGKTKKTIKGLVKKTDPKPDDANPAAPDGAMKADGAMLTKAKSKKGATAKTAKKADPAAKGEGAAAPVVVDAKGLKFSEEIAPILAGNCTRCHNAQQKRGGLDLSTFQKMMGGSAKRKVIVPGKPDESELVLRISNLSDGPKMPPGQVNLAPETIAKIEEWIKAGAILNAGIEPTANLDAISPSPEARRRRELANLSPEERDKKLEAVGMERWAKASAKSKPTVSPGKNFQLFSTLKPDRAERLLKAMETQRTTLGSILGPQGAASLGGLEKISLYVFKDLTSYVEFVRSVENRELEQGIEAHGKLDVEQPYLAAVDPLNGADESAAATAASGGGTTKKSAKTKKAPTVDEPADGPDRSLAGLLAEQLGSAAATAGGKPPRWLSYGLGAYLASRVDQAGSNYYRKMRETTAEKYRQGWESKANEALGGEGDPETIRAIGFSLCEWQATTLPRQFPTFVRGMLQGGEKLDDVIHLCFGQATTRAEFLEQWGGFVASRYGRRR